MMRQLLSLLATALFLSAAQAAPPSAESIDTLLAVTQSEKLVTAMHANMEQVLRQSMQQALGGRQMTARQQRAVAQIPEKFAQAAREELSWAKMRPLYVKIYEESFTQEEIDGLIAFYNSPAGLAFVQKMPQVMQKTVTVMQTAMVPLVDRMRANLALALSEAKDGP